jgi:NAD(P)-dependent dehydrogenase (short-subunit alcohol dehydrogenase family)
MRVAEAVYIVTGGSSGLGAATVRRFHSAGAHLLICNRDKVTGSGIEAELGQRARFICTDVASESDAIRAVEVAKREFGGLHGLINCAGIGVYGQVLGEDGPHPLELFSHCLQVNLIGTFNMLRVAAAAMSENVPNAAGERGVIVNTASIAAYEGQIGHAAYAASYAGVIGMTLPISRELARIGVRVMTIAPGPFLTPRLECLTHEELDALAKAAPFPKRLGRPDEFAALVQQIVENEMLNGETIRLDGAMRLPAI